jgi:hypothetical protein
MSDDFEREATNDAAEQPEGTTRREALGRFAKYTAPVMLALLLSEKAAATSLNL